MSAHTLLNLPTYATIQTGILTTPASASTTIVFGTPFPLGILPLIFIQNTDGSTNADVVFTTQNLTNTQFTLVQSGTGAPSAVLVSWMAVAVPATPVP
jgi:hypothetical protein